MRTEDLIRQLLVNIGENPQREGLSSTPDRVRRSIAELTSGYAQEPLDVVGDAIYTDDSGADVTVSGVEFYSLCEHHMLPFFGTATVAYTPNGRIIGLSKIPRLVHVFSRRLQVQERMTAQIADALMDVASPLAVAVETTGTHLCMSMRGVGVQGARTTCRVLRGDRSLAATLIR